MADQTIIDKDGTRTPVPLHGPEAFAAMRAAGRLAAADAGLHHAATCVPASPRASSID